MRVFRARGRRARHCPVPKNVVNDMFVRPATYSVLCVESAVVLQLTLSFTGLRSPPTHPTVDIFCARSRVNPYDFLIVIPMCFVFIIFKTI